MAETAEQRPWFFNLMNDGEEATVRILHSSTKSIEKVDTHRIELAGKKKRIRCNGDGCPLCTNGNNVETRIYLHLYDYGDNKEKVWDRTDKIIPQLDKLFESWNPLNTAVVKIKRIGNEFPKYEITPLNPMNFTDVDKALVDKPIANRFSLKRSNEDITAFLNSGEFPERKPYIPKEEYKKMKQAEQQTNEPVDNNDGPFGPATPTEKPQVQPQPQSVDNNTFDPFADSIIVKPRKV